MAWDGKEATDEERAAALHLLAALMNLVGDHSTMTVDLWQMHRIILVMRGIIVESDLALTSDNDFDGVSRALAPMIAAEAKNARAFREQNGIGLIELALGPAIGLN